MRQTPTTIERFIAAGLTIALATACGPHRAPPATSIAPASRSAACTIVPASAAHRDTVTIALTHDVDASHAPVPRNESERMFFAQLYEPLIRVDCTGQPYPALAASWRVDSSGLRWTFTLRDDARFWDGAPVTARDVAASWAVRQSSRHADSSAALSALRAASVSVDDQHTLTLILAAPRHTVPLWLASPELSIVKRDSASEWPQGTSDYRPAQPDIARLGASPSGTISLRASAASDAPVLRFRVAWGVDPRDVLDAGVDVLLTNAPAVLEYASTRQDLRVAPLPWDRTYVLLSPARVAVESASSDAEFRDALARDAVRADARGAEPPYWWGDTSACTAAISAHSVGAIPGALRVAYPRDDRVARDLADRLVALAALDTGSSPRAAMLASLVPGITAPGTTVGSGGRVIATGLSPADLAASLGRAHDLAYVLPLPRHALTPCTQAQSLIAAIGWALPGLDRDFVPADAVRAAEAMHALTQALVPLIDTRSSLIVRRGVSGVAVDWDDTPLFAVPPNAASPPTGQRP